MDDNDNLRSAYLRAARAWLDLEQPEVALATDVSAGTIRAAERGRACSDKTWAKLRAFYAERGFVLRDGDPLLIQIEGAAKDV